MAGAINGNTKEHQAYLADGGIGLIVGDGRLPHDGTEDIVELCDDAPLLKIGRPKMGPLTTNLALDYQLINNPAYKTDRRPARILGARLHVEY